VLADQYFLIAHEDRTGRSRRHPRATGLGLAAALLGEPILDDVPALDVLDLLVAQPQHRDVRTWLAFLSQDSAIRAGERLSRLGAVEPVTRRRMASRSGLSVIATQHNAVARAPANLLIRGIGMTISDRVLIDLVAVIGLARHVPYDFEAHGQASHSPPNAVSEWPGNAGRSAGN
jgi:hypothetical protein